MDEVATKKVKVKVKKTKRAIFMDVIFGIIVFLLLFLIIIKTCFFSSIVSQNSMEPTLHNNDVGLTDRVFYKLFGINRFDIIVIDRGGDVYYVKRVIGLPGETIIYYQSEDGDKLYINNKYIKEQFLTNEAKDKTCIATSNLCVTGVTLGKNEYYVLGDNRSNSLDSRFESIGNIKYSDIIGRGFIKYGTCKVDSLDCSKIDYNMK